MSKGKMEHHMYFQASSESGVGEMTRDCLATMDPGDTFTFDGVWDKWGDPIKLSYFRSIVSRYGKDTGKVFITRAVESAHGWGFAADVKREK